MLKPIQRPHSVTVLVDWNSQIHAAQPSRLDPPEVVARKTLGYVGSVVSRVLKRRDPDARFDVHLRLYHGWHKGFEPTAARKALLRLSGLDELNLSVYPNVLVRQQFGFGDCLISALSSRMHGRICCHLPNTLRDSALAEKALEEKMVDTAIASDLIALASNEPLRWLLVMGEDDDLVPPVLTAEALRGKADSPILLLRRRQQGPFLKLEGLRVDP